MDSIYYGLTIVAIFIILFWFIQNERKSPDDAALGLLATKSASAFATKNKRKRRPKFPLKPEREIDHSTDVDR
jgi:hypothetical protein